VNTVMNLRFRIGGKFLVVVMLSWFSPLKLGSGISFRPDVMTRFYGIRYWTSSTPDVIVLPP
jgi:hypothetical protein